MSNRKVTYQEELNAAEEIKRTALANMVEVREPDLRIQFVVYNKQGHIVWKGMLGAAAGFLDLLKLLPESKNGIPIGRTQ